MSGAVHPASSMRCLISGTAAAASGTFTVTRTISDPASHSSTTCRAVAAASAVSVMVIDWTTTGAPPPTWTLPTRTPTVLCSLTVFMSRLQDDHSIRMSARPDSPTGRLNGVSLAKLHKGAFRRSNRQMTVYSILRPATVVLALAIASPAVAQSGGYGSSQSGASVTSADIQRLQDQVYDTGNEVSRLRSRDQSLADRLSSQLDDLRDEVVYLKVKMRKEGSVTRSDYNDVRSRVESV